MHTRRVTSWNIWVSIWATTYGGSTGWQTDIRLGEPMSILACWLAVWTTFQSILNVLRCRGYGQIIWQKTCEVSRESMFGWDPDWSGSQEQESSYWMGTQSQSQTLLLSTANDTRLHSFSQTHELASSTWWLVLLDGINIVFYMVESILVTVIYCNTPNLAFISTEGTYIKWLITHYNVVWSRYKDTVY